MRLFTKKNLISGASVSIVLFIGIILFFVVSISNASKEIDDNEVITLRKSIDKAIVNCYAIEGAYPESIEYIEENYGVVIDRDRFIVIYEVLGPNVLPNVIVKPISEIQEVEG